MRPRLSRRKFLAGLAAAAAGGVAYTRWGEPHWIEVTRRAVATGRDPAPRPLRVLHLSDFHASEVVSLEFIAKAIALGLAASPDLVLLTGDFITDRFGDLARYADVLRRLSERAPTFACLGNHDGGAWARRMGGYPSHDEVRRVLQDARITCLQNETHALVAGGRAVQLVGVGDLWTGLCEPATAFRNSPPRDAAMRLVLNHNPDAKDALRPFDWDLMLCGHTHGGQLRLPLIGTPFAPVADRRYVEGLHRWENRWLFITRGVGNLHGLRFNCRPEVSVLEVT